MAKFDLATVMARYPNAVSFTFGDGCALSDRLISLVRSGKKTATCGALRDTLAEGEPVPTAGALEVVLDWDGCPALVLRLTDVTVRRFCDVDEHFALSEGENDTLAGWQHDHRKFFERNGGWAPEMDLICQRFEIVEVFE